MQSFLAKQQKHFMIYLAVYVALTFLLIIQVFTHPQFDGDDFLSADYFISQGLAPHVDFFDAHPLFTNYFFAQIFWLTGSSPSSLILLSLLDIILTLFCAYLCSAIAKKNSFRNPHVASILFLSSYTAVGFFFQRYDFAAMLGILLFFWFEKPFLRGLTLGFLILLSPITFFAAGVMGLAYLFQTFREHKKKLAPIIVGLLLSLLIWRLVQYQTPLAAMYQDIFVFNGSLGSYYPVPFLEFFFFTGIFEISALLFGTVIIYRKWRESKFVSLAAVFVAAMLFQILMMNIVYGLFTRLKMPALVPITVLMIILISDYKAKIGYLVVAFHLFLVLLAFTPNLSLPLLTDYALANELNDCVKQDATFYYDASPPENVSRVHLFREPSEFHWYLRHWATRANITLPPTAINDSYYICGNTISASAIQCSEEHMQSLQNACNANKLSRPLWIPVRERLRQVID